MLMYGKEPNWAEMLRWTIKGTSRKTAKVD